MHLLPSIAATIILSSVTTGAPVIIGSITEALTTVSTLAAQSADVPAAQLTSATQVADSAPNPISRTADDVPSRVAKAVPEQGTSRSASLNLLDSNHLTARSELNMAQEKRQLAYTRYKNADGASQKALQEISGAKQQVVDIQTKTEKSKAIFAIQNAMAAARSKVVERLEIKNEELYKRGAL